ncbi:MFS general substrate transporter [Phlegmacium glaucopus]|nr:MFS general substrate transporter [Phlegmacium glaucopus]
MESSEETPLLPPRNLDHDHNEVYRHFTRERKRGILAIVAFTGLIPLFVSGTFIPSIPQIAKDLDSTGPIVGLAVSVSILAASLGALFGASYSTFYGRKPIYLTALPLLFLGSLGVASSRTIPQLMSWRFIQAIGASPGLVVGTGVIGDIYRLEERGQAMGIFFAAILLGPALAPLAGGFAAHYYSWRLLQQFLGLVGLFVFFLIMFFLPETYHPGERGVDKLDPSQLPKWRPVILNPLRPLWLLRSPNLLAVALAGFTILLTDYVLLVPLAYTIGVRYNIKNEALIGACFLPAGVGNMIGAPLAGRLSDRIVVYYRKKRGGEWYPEDRLRATLPGALILVPLSVLISGLLTEYVPGTLGLVLNLICLFINGVGVDIVLSPSAAYLVDLVHSRSAEAMAANNAFRSLLISIAVSGTLPMIGTYGLVVTNTATALLAWVGFGLLWFTIEYGERLRAVVDVGFSTADNN